MTDAPDKETPDAPDSRLQVSNAGGFATRQRTDRRAKRPARGKRFLNWQSIFLPALAVLALFAFLVTAYFQLQDTNRKIQLGGPQSSAWQLNQVQVKLLRFVNVLDRVYLPQNAEIGFIDVVDSYEQLIVDIDRALNRLDAEQSRLAPTASAALGGLRDDLLSIRATVESLEFTPYQEVAAVRLRMEGHATRIQRLPKEALEIQTERLVLVQNQVSALTTRILLYILVILVIAGVLVYFLIDVQRKAVAFQNYLITALDTIPDAFALFDERDRLTVTNERFRQDFDLKAEDVEAAPTFGELMERNVRHGLYPRIQGGTGNWVRRRKARHLAPTQPFEEPFGEDRWVRVAERRTKRGETVLIQADITVLKNRESQLYQSRARFQRLVETSFDGILVVQNAQIVSSNKRLAEILGFGPDELTGQSIADVLEVITHQEIDPSTIGWSTLLRQAEADQIEVAARQKSGNSIFLEASVRTFEVNGGYEKVWAIRDVTSRHAQEAELLRAKEEAEQGSRAKSDFLAMMSHEIRTPMNAVLGMTNLLIDTQLDKRQHKYAATVRDSAHGLLTILNDMLDLTKLEAGKLDLERVAFDFGQVVQSILDLMAPNASEKDLELSADLSGLNQRFLVGDPQRLRQVMLNLVGNAIKFTETGRVQVRVDQDISQVQPDDTPRVSVRVSVIDTGIGINSDKIKQLFNPFTQADADISRRFGGTGLGLAICKRIIDQMQGEITVSSVAGAGSTFFFSVDLAVAEGDAVHHAASGLTQLPYRDDAQLDIFPDDTGLSTQSIPRLANPLADPLADPPVNPLDQINILVVEDSPTNQDVVRAFLEKTDYMLTMAENGAQALELVQQNTFNAVLMDLSMPVMDGLEATRQIRQLGGANQSLPIIALTANALPDDRRRCFDAGMNDYLAKPIDLRLLLSKLARWTAVADVKSDHPPTPTNDAKNQTADQSDDQAGNQAPERIKGQAKATIDREQHAGNAPIIRIGGSENDDSYWRVQSTLDQGPDSNGVPNLAEGSATTPQDGDPQVNIDTLSQLAAASAFDPDTWETTDLVSTDVLQQLTEDTGPQIVGQLVDSFLNELGDHVTALEQGTANKDASAVRHRAHTIKGSSATFGAMQLSALAKAVEVACDDGDWDQVVDLSASVQPIAEQTANLLRAILEI